jgi:putative ABC transport system permease protein
MLTLKNATKSYTVGDFTQKALDNVSISFRDKEFVAILGPSGSGKTTLLNMIGGLDRYDSGDLLIDGKSTQDFKDKDWDSYRNHAVGFIFQSYNLITHTSVLSNVEVGMTLSGLPAEQRKARAIEVLTDVGLKDHIYKKPNQLSGGQMQRVAIARALANHPEIIMADEPTGAIDSATSSQIMKIIQDIAKDKLVIMVTHDKSLAKEYADRIIELKDGHVISDSNPYVEESKNNGRLNLKKTAMAFTQAVRLSFNNLKTKKFRTLITAFAGSIGIIGVAMVLALANGLNQEIDSLERSTLAQFPLQIDPFPIDIQAARADALGESGDEIITLFPDVRVVYPYEPQVASTQQVNVLTEDYLDYVEAMNPEWYFEITPSYNLNIPLYLQETEASYLSVDRGRGGVFFNPAVTSAEFLNDYYDVIDGRLPENANEMMLVVDTANRLNIRFFRTLGLSIDVAEYDFETFYDLTFYTFFPEDYFQPTDEEDRFVRDFDLAGLVAEEKGFPLKIVGIVRQAEDSQAPGFLDTGIKYHPDLEKIYLEEASTSSIATTQANTLMDVLTGNEMTAIEQANRLRFLGYTRTPSQILIYPVDFNAKTLIREYLDAYNVDKPENEQIIYTDLAALVTELTGDLIDGVSYVLIAFSAISLVVSSIMIGIITYVSVLERTKEIGILRSLGARKKDISRVFNAETIIIGFTAGAIGVLIAFGLTFPLNALIRNLVDGIDNLAQLPLVAIFALIGISIFLTFIAGLIPSRIAANKHPVDALRIE